MPKRDSHQLGAAAQAATTNITSIRMTLNAEASLHVFG